MGNWVGRPGMGEGYVPSLARSAYVMQLVASPREMDVDSRHNCLSPESFCKMPIPPCWLAWTCATTWLARLASLLNEDLPWDMTSSVALANTPAGGSRYVPCCIHFRTHYCIALFMLSGRRRLVCAVLPSRGICWCYSLWTAYAVRLFPKVHTYMLTLHTTIC